MSTAPPTDTAPPAKRTDRTHWLYVAVIIAVFLGIGVGCCSRTSPSSWSHWAPASWH